MGNGNATTSAERAAASPADAQDLKQHQDLFAEQARRKNRIVELECAVALGPDPLLGPFVRELEAALRKLCGIDPSLAIDDLDDPASAYKGSWLDPDLTMGDIQKLRGVVEEKRATIARLTGAALEQELRDERSSLTTWEARYPLYFQPGNGAAKLCFCGEPGVKLGVRGLLCHKHWDEAGPPKAAAVESAPGQGLTADRPPETRPSGEVPAATGAAGGPKVTVEPESEGTKKLKALLGDLEAEIAIDYAARRAETARRIATNSEHERDVADALAAPAQAPDSDVNSYRGEAEPVPLSEGAAKLQAFVECVDRPSALPRSLPALPRIAAAGNYRGWAPSGAFKVGKLKKATRALIDKWHEATPENKRNEIGAKIVAAGWTFTAGSLPEPRPVADLLLEIGFERDPKAKDRADWGDEEYRQWLTDWTAAGDEEGDERRMELKQELERETSYRAKAAAPVGKAAS